MTSEKHEIDDYRLKQRLDFLLSDGDNREWFEEAREWLEEELRTEGWIP